MRGMRVIINSGEVEVEPGRSLFEAAESVGVRVPTSCQKQGKCRECLLEVAEGGEHLSPPAPEEAHLSGCFRLACRARVTAESGLVRCHTLRRAALRIEARGAPRRIQRRQERQAERQRQNADDVPGLDAGR